MVVVEVAVAVVAVMVVVTMVADVVMAAVVVIVAIEIAIVEAVLVHLEDSALVAASLVVNDEKRGILMQSKCLTRDALATK